MDAETREETYGDLYQLECPVCHEIMRDLWDGWKNEENTDHNCGHCNALLRLNFSVDVTVTARVPQNTKSKGQQA